MLRTRVNHRTIAVVLALALISTLLCASAGLWSAVRNPWYATVSDQHRSLPVPAEWPQPLKARGWPKPEWASEGWRTDRRVIFVGTHQIVLADINGDGVEESALNMWRQENWEFG